MTPDSPAQHSLIPHGFPDVPGYEVVVIGAGQAGLAVGYHLQQAAVDFRILEAAETIGGSWAGRWESLRLFTPAGYDGLPGMAFPAPRWHYPAKDEVAGYLAVYAATFDLPVTTGTPVTGLSQGPDGRFVLELAGGATLGARAVVVATGAFGHPWTPALLSTWIRPSRSCTPTTTAPRSTCPGRWCWWSGAGTPGCRSPRSWPGRAGRCTWPPAPAPATCRNGCWAGTCSGGCTPLGSWAPRRPAGSGGVCAPPTR